MEILGSFRAKQFCQKRNKIVVEGGQTIISGTVYIEVKKKSMNTFNSENQFI